MWCMKSFNALTTSELFVIYALRQQVFIAEQQCSYQDVDNVDLDALHLFCIDEEYNDRIPLMMSYCRLYEQADGVHIGRVVVSPQYRGKGLGRELMIQAIAVCQQQFTSSPIVIQAQAYLQSFYESLGFEATSDVYLEDNIPHLDMIYRGE